MYQWTSLEQTSLTRLSDGASIPVWAGNRDYDDAIRWVAEGNTIAPAVLPAVSQSDYEAAIDRHLANVAAERGYKSEASILSYRDSSIAAWSTEANAYALWRDDVWAAAYVVLADVQSGRTEAPSQTELLSTLPAISWPST